MILTGIAIQGRQDYSQWMTAFYVRYSMDGVYFSEIKNWWNAYVKTFTGNQDRDSVQTRPFDPPIYARYVRIIPRGWRSHICMRFELYGSPWNKCDMPLGIEDMRVASPMMRASSYQNFYCRAGSGRLNGRRQGRMGGAWCAQRSDRRQWLQIDFGALTRVTRVGTQGRQNSVQWVKTYTLSYSRNGITFVYYKENGRTKIFNGNYDQHMVVRHRLTQVITGRYFRFHPITWYSWISMRVELYGCIIEFTKIYDQHYFSSKGVLCNKPLGMQNGRIRSTQLTASSSYDRNSGPDRGRLHVRRAGARWGAWIAKYNTRTQWLQVYFAGPKRLVKFATQGRQDARQWVTKYSLSYSQNGINWAYYKENSGVKVLEKYFIGNRDQNSVVQYRLFPRIKCLYIKIHPYTWYSHITMRVEFYGCAEDRCVMPLGVEDKRIPPGRLTASTYYSSGYAPWYGRLNSIYSWGVRSNRHGEWFQVNFLETRVIKGVATQGRQNGNYWVKSYTIGYSVDEMTFTMYKQGRGVKVFDGNSDRHTIVYHQFIKPFTAVNVRIYPKSWYGWICLRAEFYGCAAALCNAPLGVSNKRVIPDSRITASSEFNQYHAARLARLGQVKRGSYIGAWCARHNNYYQWLKVDFGRLRKVTQIVTQGRFDYGQWVTSFYLTSSMDNVHWSMYRFKSANKLFQANRDQHSLVQNAITPPIYARFVKLIPRGWYRHICMRVEYYGCFADRCDVPLGFQDGRVLRSMFIASSMYNHYYGPWSARLQAQNHGQTRGGWVAKYNNVNQWWQVDLGVTSRVKRIATQARYDANQWVKSYTLSYSNDGARFSPYRYRKRVKIFQGNYERYLVNEHRFNPTIKARFIRIHPKTWYGYISLRVELYGCRLGVLCNRPMGMQSGSIKNNQVTASSYINQNKDQYHAPWLGRLQRHRKGRYAGAWVAKYNTPYQWLQVDFGRPSKIIKISTQGRHDAPMWVRQYYVTRSLDAIHFKQYEERNSLKV
ncbi:PREDICTED: uncharacterized protein LOC107326864 [Acropora digitifera]|uniref:uncharacterized protein LOC107326864 n=1 Tax=Acropora digitifera TaxID=70779 RepID=UPI00077B272B|nr:PREDICTED: uncharacterized protein LOC107326864 [Acropora digitifera]